MARDSIDNAPSTIAAPLLRWFDQHGRHDLPWQHPRSPYRVWVAEIMLQQTQVTTVVPYFNAFMARFADVAALADASEDDVMAHWAGLGYYARARNLHATAKRLVADHGGVFPRDVDALMTLPGIGRSTAGAIVAQAFGIWAPILDGNAKRVIARLAAVTAVPGTVSYERPLWTLATRYTPEQRVTDYTQAIMDLGATLCTRSRPFCSRCPLSDGCLAYQRGLETEIPAKRLRRKRPQRAVTLMLIEDDAGRLLLEKRPPAGIWGGLWSLPARDEERPIVAQCRERFGLDVCVGAPMAPFEHGFTHFLLTIHAARVHALATTRIMEDTAEWFARDGLPGLPAPIARLIETPQSDLNL